MSLTRGHKATGRKHLSLLSHVDRLIISIHFPENNWSMTPTCKVRNGHNGFRNSSQIFCLWKKKPLTKQLWSTQKLKWVKMTQNVCSAARARWLIPLDINERLWVTHPINALDDKHTNPHKPVGVFVLQQEWERKPKRKKRKKNLDRAASTQKMLIRFHCTLL